MRRTWKRTGYPLTTHIAAAVLLLILFVTGTYFLVVTDTKQSIDSESLLTELTSNQEKWNSVQPVAYRYVVARICTCPGEDKKPFIATHQNGVRTSRFPIPVESDAGEWLERPPKPVWMDDIFASVRHEIEEGREIAVEYNSHYGFPRRAVFTSHDGGIEPTSYEIRDFEILEHHPNH